MKVVNGRILWDSAEEFMQLRRKVIDDEHNLDKLTPKDLLCLMQLFFFAEIDADNQKTGYSKNPNLSEQEKNVCFVAFGALDYRQKRELFVDMLERIKNSISVGIK